MPNQRLILAAGFALITITTLWFGFSATSLSQNSLLRTCAPAITVAASTCQVTHTATLFQTSTLTVKENKPSPAASVDKAAQAGDLNNIDAGLLEDGVIPSKPSRKPTPHVTAAPKPALTPENDENFNLNDVLTKYACSPAASEEARKLARDTTPSVKCNVVRGDNVVLSRKSKLPSTSLKKFYSVGRKPSAGCWTYTDRFGQYVDAVPRFLRSLGAVNSCNKDIKRALVVHMAKGQSWNKHFRHSLISLINEAGWLGGYHIYLLVFVDGDKAEQKDYVDHVIPEPFRPLAITFNSDDLKGYLGEGVPFDKYASNTHVAVQKFMHDYANYEFVYFVNTHTRLMGRWDTLLQSVEDEYAFHQELGSSAAKQLPKLPDLVTFDVTREPEEKWEALEWACLQFFKGEGKDKGKVRRSLGAMGGFSRRMIEALAAVNMQKINCNSEYFPPTVAAHKNLTTFFYQHPLYSLEDSPSIGATAKISANDAITVQQDKVAFDLSYSTDAKEAQTFWEEWVNNPEHF
ncbi:hypothetical protein H072_10784 [Dactylellina haptotyla CBS 200.50]|uniref:Uncharacterized protein n=1 Tax=Dactylellina haptotyla (strain CBS 200.50) TaxID=1284197 RepID=S8BKG5_DACHA|nr:hypothetical protein H072_10784 [Dactylellina haptotyla CBS 200.50]